jgi:hypothetical protein
LSCSIQNFLANFQILKNYAIVRALSVRAATIFQATDLDRFCPFMAQSKAYDPRT